MNKDELDKLKKAGKIAKEVVEYARTISKKNVKLLELADKIEHKIHELGGKPAFPVNLSINEIAAHATPSFDDVQVAHGLLKVDIGVHVDGFVADTAFSVDLENDDENKKLIAAAEAGLGHAVHHIKYGISLGEIGKYVEDEVKKAGFVAVRNLSGHSIEQYDVHAGVSIPNYNSGSDEELDEGVFAIEPFSTNGHGLVKDGKPSGIYNISKEGNVRDSFARDVLGYIIEEYKTLPFCSRWIYKKFGGRGLLALRMIEQAGLLHHYSQLVEVAGGKVAQAEHTVFVSKKEVVQIT